MISPQRIIAIQEKAHILCSAGIITSQEYQETILKLRSEVLGKGKEIKQM